MTNLLKLGFLKLGKDELGKPFSSELQSKLVTPSLPASTPIKVVKPGIQQINKYIPNPPKIHPLTQKIMRGVTSDAKKYNAGDKKVWKRKVNQLKTDIKDPKKVVGAVAATGLYLGMKNNPKFDNLVSLVRNREVNIINKSDQRFSLKVPKDLRKGNWNLNWSKAF